MRSDLSFQLCNPILGCAKLMRKLLRHIDGMPAVLLGNIGGLVEKLEDRLTGFIELTVIAVRALRCSREGNDIRAGTRTVSLPVHG